MTPPSSSSIDVRRRSRLRVLHVSDFSAPYPGAFIRQLRMLDEHLRECGGEPLALAFPQRAADRRWLTDLESEGIEVRLLPEGRSRAERHVANAVSDLLAQLRPDIVHTHFGTYDLSVTRAVRQWRRAGVSDPALVWHYRTALEETVGERSVARRMKDWLKYARAGRATDRCIAVTEALADEVAARGMGARACAVVAGCDTDTFVPDSAARRRVRGELGIRDDQLLIMHMGWHWHRKGGDLLAAAARELVDGRGWGDRLVFASIGAPVDEVEAPIRRIEPTDAVHELHQASDIFVSASRSEGFGNGLVEALSCERVAVAAFVEGQREIFTGLEDGCVPIPADSAAALAAALHRLLERQADWARLGAVNRAHVVARNSMRRWARELTDVYADLRPGLLADVRTSDDSARLSA